MRRSDRSILRYELAGYFRGPLPFRFIALAPVAAFLAAWAWQVASPFAAAAWLVCVGLEPRINNMFYGSPGELEALSLFPTNWGRVVLLKNLATAGIAAGALALFSVVALWFSPERLAAERAADALLYLSTVAFPILILGNEASVRQPRAESGAFSGGIPEAVWMSIILLVVSLPYFLFTGLVERPWYCVPYAALTAGSWFFGSVPQTAARISLRRIELWQSLEPSSNS